MSIAEREIGTWTAVCPVGRLTPDRGVAALIDGSAVAIFLLSSGALHAIDNVDPVSGAGVLSRGIVGEVDGAASVASPMYKQRFDLATGRCIDVDSVTVRTHEVDVQDGMVVVRVRGSA